MYKPGTANTIFFDINEMFNPFSTTNVFPEDNITYTTRKVFVMQNESNDCFGA